MIQEKTSAAEGVVALRTASVLAQIAALRTASTPELKQRWRQLLGCEPPPFSRPYLQSRLIHKLQELHYGGLKPETVARLEALGRELDGGKLEVRRRRANDRPIAGTQLVRQYQGVQHVVTVLADGFAYEGLSYRSLSAIARHITGTRWNGLVFFGLKSSRDQT